MSSFDASWLALREPADRQARNAKVLAAFGASLGKDSDILDIACGTGSTYRAISPVLNGRYAWTLADHDPTLLAEAKRLSEADDLVRVFQADLNNLAALPIKPSTVITASALFDLCSSAFVATFVDHLDQQKTSLYTGLNYNGVMRWTIPHALDDTVTAAFNLHQKTNKGFGPALGPDAAEHLRALLEASDYHVTIGESPWILTPEQDALQRAFIDGVARAAEEMGALSRQEIARWRRFRLDTIDRPEASCEVGHLDIFARKQ